jgi:hypothetical protein
MVKMLNIMLYVFIAIKKGKNICTGGMDQVVESLLSKCENPSLIPSTD